MPIVLRSKTVRIPEQNLVVGTGWLPPTFDQKDYTEAHPEVAQLTSKLKVPAAKATLKAGLPAKVDLRAFCSPIENQLQLGSCTANATVGVVEYFQKRAFNKYLDGSRLFVYKNTRNLMGVTGDTGAWLRNAMGALVLCGVPDEKYWPYTDVDPDFDRDPSSFAYSVANDFRALKYFCHDPLGSNVAAGGRGVEREEVPERRCTFHVRLLGLRILLLCRRHRRLPDAGTGRRDRVGPRSRRHRLRRQPDDQKHHAQRHLQRRFHDPQLMGDLLG